MSEALTKDDLEDRPVEQPARNAPQERRCLRCKTTFLSAWCGERICPRCKSTSDWRSGVGLGA